MIINLDVSEKLGEIFFLSCCAILFKQRIDAYSMMDLGYKGNIFTYTKKYDERM
jgi:hypothetical protein